MDATTTTAGADALERALRTDAPQAQTLIGKGAEITTKAQTGAASGSGNSLPATTADAVPATIFDTAVQAALVALPLEDTTLTTQSTSSSTTNTGGSTASVAAVVTADNRYSTDITEAGQAAVFSI